MTNKKIRILVDEVFNLFIKTPRGSLVRYTFPNKKEFSWKGSYILGLQKWGVWTLHSKEINVAGENIFYLQVDEKKIRDVKEYLQTKNRSDEKSKEPRDLSPKLPYPLRPAWQEFRDAERATNDLVRQFLGDVSKTIAPIKESKEHKFPHRLSAGTKWQNFTIKFLDNENVYIQVKQFKQNASHKEMGFVGKGNNPNPSVAWEFLKVLSTLNGELKIRDKEARDKYKKQKELLAKSLQSYFSIDYDPFYPYRSSTEKQGNSYKIKITLIPPPEGSEKPDIPEEKDDLGIKEYLDEQNPEVHENQ